MEESAVKIIAAAFGNEVNDGSLSLAELGNETFAL